MRLSVVMVSYHTGPVLFHALERCLWDAVVARVIVVDNGNPPEVTQALSRLAEENPRILHLSGHGNVGFARACNLGAAHAEGEYVLLLNPDCLLPVEGAKALTDALEACPDAWLAGGMLQNPDGSEQRGSRRQLLTPKTALAEALMLHRLSGAKRLNDHGRAAPKEVAEVPAVSGACLCLPLARYRELGGMDEGYFLHVEDLDLCLRVQRAGGKVLFVPQVKLTHLLSTSDASPAFIERCKAKGFTRYFRTHFSGSMPRWLLLCAVVAVWARYALRLALYHLRSAKAPNNAALALHGLMRIMREESLRPRAADFSGERVLLTGATSQIGVCAMARLLQSGAHVVALSRAPLAFTHPRLRWLEGDMEALNALNPGEATCLIHTAPLWLLPPALPALERAGIVRAVAIGSTSVFGKKDSNNPQERRTVERLAEAEAALADAASVMKRPAVPAFVYTLLRPTLVYGLGMDGNVTKLSRLIRRFRFLPIVPPASGLRQPVHADDLAIAALEAMGHIETRNQAYNVSGGETLSYRAMAERLFDVFSLKPRFLPLAFLPRLLDGYARFRPQSPINGEMANRMNRDLVFSHEDAARDFAYAPRAFLRAGRADLGEGA